MTLNIANSLLALSPTQFENLTFDLLQHVGMQNLVWRTPGADTGRDIEAIVVVQDISGQIEAQQWYIECKRYTDTIDWATVWKKIAFADNHGAKYLLIVTNSNPSPACETEITKWNTDRRNVKVRFWRGYDIERLLKLHPIVATKYGLLPQQGKVIEFGELSFDLMKVVQATYSAYATGVDITPYIEFCGALSELMTVRMHDITEYGRFFMGSRMQKEAVLWIKCDTDPSSFEEVGLWALCAALRYVSAASEVVMTRSSNAFLISPTNARIAVSSSGLALLQRISTLSLINIEGSIENGAIIICPNGDI